MSEFGGADFPGEFVDRKYHFPPFPSVPADVQIVAFADFREYGTRIIGADGVERDGLGIRTIALPSRSKGTGKKKKKNKSSANRQSASKAEWWKDWEDAGEHVPYCNTALSISEKLNQAAFDFEKHYPINAHLHIQQLWSHLKHFIGVTAEPTALKDDDVMSDDDGDDNVDPAFVEAQNTAASATAMEGAWDLSNAVHPPENELSFLVDPAQDLKIFLSSYIYDKGQTWDHLKLDAAPRLVRFFVRFLMRAAILGEGVATEALAVADLAARELPRIPSIANALPDAFGEACVNEWTRTVNVWKDVNDKGDEDAPPAKRAKLDRCDNRGADDSTTEEKGDDATDIQDVNLLTATADGDSGWGGTGGWGANGGWGDTSADAADIADRGEGWGDATGGWGGADETFASSLPAPATLVTVVGPAAADVLKRTLAPGVVERSARRILSIELPPSPSQAVNAGEHNLDNSLARVVLDPWPLWRGKDDPASAPELLRPGPTEHNMLHDPITLLVAPLAAEALCVGMGLHGRWVQLAQVRDAETALNSSVDTEQKEAEESGGKEIELAGHWYVEELTATLPSFWSI